MVRLNKRTPRFSSKLLILDETVEVGTPNFRAAAENPADAAVVGVPVRRVYALTFMLAAGVSGLGGALLAMVFSFTPASGVEFLLTGFIVVVLGGLGSVKGTWIAGLTLGVVESLAAVFFGDGYRLFAGLLVFLVVLALRPQGLFGSRR